MIIALETEFRTTAPSAAEWQLLVDASTPGGQFATATWIRAWSECYLPYQNWQPPMRYVVVRAGDGQLQAVFPVATQKQSGISIASLGGFYWPFRTPIIPERSATAVLEALASVFTASRRTLALRYGPVPEAQSGIEGLNVALANQGWRVHGLKLGETYAIDLPGSWEEFERSLGKSLKTNTYYYERKMQREGEFEIRHIKNTVSTSWSETIRDLGVVEEKSWQNKRGGKLRFLGERNQNFWTTLLSESGFAEMVSVWLIYFKGEPVSFCFCLDCADIRHIIANNYVERVHAYSTGSILYRYVFRDALESSRIRSVNIGMGDAGYKSRWGANPSYQLMDWIAFRPGIRGYLLDLAYTMHQSFKKRWSQASDSD